MKPKKYDPKKPLKLNKAGFLGTKKSAAKIKENKPSAKKPAKKREGESSIRIVKKAPNPQQVRKIGKSPLLAAPYGKAAVHAANYSAAVFDDMKADLAFLRKAIFQANVGFAQQIIADTIPPARRDLMGEEQQFDANAFKECLAMFSEATSPGLFFPAHYAKVLQECRAAGFNISAMIQTNAVGNWDTADIERLISYLTTLCHIKRAVRSAPETNVPTDIVK
jgi:hypothetical protein